MLTDSVRNEDVGSVSLLADVADDSCTLQFIEIVPLARDTDGFSAVDCYSGDWSAEVIQGNLPVVKPEPDDVSNNFLC